jgi:hypothetical protein
MTATILPERSDSSEARRLIEELEAFLDPLYPRASRHGYSVDRLIEEAAAFFQIRTDGAPACCGGVKLLDGEYREDPLSPFFGKGIAAGGPK